MKRVISSLSSELTSLDQVIKDDLKSISSSLDPSNINIEKSLKSFMVAYISIKLKEQFAWALPYVKYLPKPKKEKKTQPIKISKNRIYNFPQIGSLPIFWLKNFGIDYQSKSKEFSISVKNISSDPSLINKMGKIDFKLRMIGEEFIRENGANQNILARKYKNNKSKITDLSVISSGNQGLSLDHSLTNWELSINSLPGTFLHFRHGFQDNLLREIISLQNLSTFLMEQVASATPPKQKISL